MNNLKDKSLEIITKYNNGITCSKLATEYGVKYMAIWKLLKSKNAYFQRNKLSKEKELALLLDYKNGIRSPELGKKYGITQASASNYIRRNKITVHPNGVINRINTQFFKTLTKESLWLLGWFYSDGNVSKSKNGFNITVHSNDEEVLLKMQKIMDSNVNAIYRPKNRKIMVFYGCEPTIHSDLISLGCVPNKSLIIRYPTFFTEDCQHWSFLRGILEGDGHIGFKSKARKPGLNCEFASGSLLFLQDIASVLRDKLQIETKIVERANSNSKKLIIMGGKSSVFKFLDCLYKDCPENLRLERKYQIYLDMHKKSALIPDYDYVNKDKYIEGYFLSPNNQVYHVRGLKKFAKEVNISIGCLYNLLKKRKYKFTSRKYGWSPPTQEQIDIAKKSGTIVEKFY